MGIMWMKEGKREKGREEVEEREMAPQLEGGNKAARQPEMPLNTTNRQR